MRLLKCLANGDISLEPPRRDDEIPQYAILSHTWGNDSEEVTYGDMINGTGQDKAGFEKIRFCGEQARNNDLQHFWVDSCCINKDDKAEESRAIRSMYRWYRNATRCYVYLSDVHTGKRKRDDDDAQSTWQPAFQKSRWFRRGWTLQELLGPQSVEFFSQERQRLGDKHSLKKTIHDITYLPMTALEGRPPSLFSINDRFSWIELRETKVEEDQAYALFGIFGVSMTPRYGEGVTKAFERLQVEIDRLQACIRDLRHTDPRLDKMRIVESKDGLLVDCYHWILEHPDFKQWRDDQQNHLLWIKGDPGKGKTMLLCGIIDELNKPQASVRIVSYFFCQASDSRINNATAVLRGLLYMLVSEEPSLISHIQQKHDHAGKELFQDANAWTALSDIFTDILQDPNLPETYFIIDALDECTERLSQLLVFIAQKSASSPRANWIVSSRNWPEIGERLERAGAQVKLSLELNAESVSTAVSIFIRDKVDQLALQNGYDDRTRAAHLQQVELWEVENELDEFPPELVPLYERMLKQIVRSRNAVLCRQILASTAVTYRPITLQELTSLVDMPERVSRNLESLKRAIGLCGSFLTIREDTVYLVHQSAKDFLLAQGSKDVFTSGVGETHYKLFVRSLDVMSRTLRRDIYGISAPGKLIEEVMIPDPDPLAASRYSCIYWVDHLSDCRLASSDHEADLHDGGIVGAFIREKYLYWLEALSLCGSMSKGVLAMSRLEALIKVWMCRTIDGCPLLTLSKERVAAPALQELVRDAGRFSKHNKRPIEISPLQAYVSALIFSPTNSLIRRHFSDEEPAWVKVLPSSCIRNTWSPCLQTLESDDNIVLSVAFSHDSTQLAAAGWTGSVEIWDAHSGERTAKLGNSHYSGLVLFSHDSRQLASVTDDCGQIWDASSGVCVATFKSHGQRPTSLAFSHDSTRLAVVSEKGPLRIWDASSGECLSTIEIPAARNGNFKAVTFSPDSTRLALVLDDSSVWTWDPMSGQLMAMFETDGGSVKMAVFSPDSSRLALGVEAGTVRVYKSSSGKHIPTFAHEWRGDMTGAFSQDSTRLALASLETIEIWNISSGECEASLRGHGVPFTSVIFSYDSTRLASASWDKFVRIWDVGIGVHTPELEGHSKSITSLSFSHDSKLLASASYDDTMRIWDTGSGKCVSTIRGDAGPFQLVAFSHDSTRLATSTGWTGVVQIWNTKGHCLVRVGHGTDSDLDDSVMSLAFSHDSSWLATGMLSGDARIWDASGECVTTVKRHDGALESVTFSHDSKWLALADDKTVRAWDTRSCEYVAAFEGHQSRVHSVAFSGDSMLLASSLWDREVLIWDTSSRECVAAFSIDSDDLPREVFFDTTGRYIHAGTGMLEIDRPPRSQTSLNQAESDTVQHQVLGVSTDKAWITNSLENLVWVPPECRGTYKVCVSTNTIGIGSGSGIVWMCKVEYRN